MRKKIECVVCGQSPEDWALRMPALEIGLCVECCHLAQLAREVSDAVDALPEDTPAMELVTGGQIRDMAEHAAALERLGEEVQPRPREGRRGDCKAKGRRAVKHA